MNELVLEKKIPKNWAITYLDKIRLNKSKIVTPNKTKDQLFELYSVPAFNDKKPEMLLGSKIGSNKQTIEEGTVLLCKIN
ncbi:MAG: hypothetical protein IIC67_09840, partial [Thaumarchaeota archaeon]|nr:hypothetical protein [Nitrososphaerota archaeon]